MVFKAPFKALKSPVGRCQQELIKIFEIRFNFAQNLRLIYYLNSLSVCFTILQHLTPRFPPPFIFQIVSVC